VVAQYTLGLNHQTTKISGYVPGPNGLSAFQSESILNFYATFHRHPIIHRYNVCFHDEFCLHWYRHKDRE